MKLKVEINNLKQKLNLPHYGMCYQIRYRFYDSCLMLSWVAKSLLNFLKVILVNLSPRLLQVKMP